MPVTGGGLVALVHPGLGLRGLFRGEDRLTGELALTLDGVPVGGSERGRAGRGAWSRTVRLEHGGALLETGLLCDAPQAMVLQWLSRPAGSPSAPPLPPSSRLLVRIHIGHGDPPEAATLPLSPGEAATLVVLPGDAPPDRSTDLLRSLDARRRMRARRSLSHGKTGLSVLVDGSPDPSVERALLSIDDAPLGMGAQGEPLGPFLAGARPDRPWYLQGVELAELGTAALESGRRALARAILETALDHRAIPPLPLLHLAADWVAWTGDARPLSARRSALERVAASTGVPVALDLSGLREALPPRRTPEGASMTPAGGTPAAAAVVRDWVEGCLGAIPDGPFGRLRLAPRIAESGAGEVRGLRVGDASVSVVWSRSEHSVRVHVSQSEGRVPLNLVFEPLLPQFRPGEVRIGGEPAQVDVSREGDQARVRCQFPLDPGRDMEILAAP